MSIISATPRRVRVSRLPRSGISARVLASRKRLAAYLIITLRSSDIASIVKKGDLELQLFFVVCLDDLYEYSRIFCNKN